MFSKSQQHERLHGAQGTAGHIGHVQLGRDAGAAFRCGWLGTRVEVQSLCEFRVREYFEGTIVYSAIRGPRIFLVCDNGHIQRTQKAHARRFKTKAFHCTIGTGQRVVAGINSLGDVMPEFAVEWDQAANGDLTPFMVSRASHKKVGWIYPEGHHYPAYIANRTLPGTGCPHCASSFSARHR